MFNTAHCVSILPQAQVDATGLLPVAMFNVNYTTTPDGEVYHDDAVRQAIHMTTRCGGAVFFAPGTPWAFNSTVVIDDHSGLELRGAGAGPAFPTRIPLSTLLYGEKGY